ncbi:MAG TPA: rhodanese-like domain-containing protein [Patescibacteria group bacterium]|nr:rhodanese-like domain-containing protein [Patescibacteria group bacterium]
MSIKYAIFAIAVAAFVIVAYFYYGEKKDGNVANEERHEDEVAESYEIHPGNVVDKIKNEEDVILLDVRTPEEYEEIHLKNALLLPVQELSAQSLADSGLGEDAKDREIIIYCRSGARSKTAYDIMKSLGYANIKSVSGGMIHWEEDQYPFTETGAYTGSRMIMKDKGAVISENGPRISLDRSFHDFGVIMQYGGTIQETFVVNNTGTETLTIGDITTSCSCTSTIISATSIDPGKSAELTVIFNPNFHAEPLDVFKRTVFIPTNDPTVPEAEIVIQVDIAEGE